MTPEQVYDIIREQLAQTETDFYTEQGLYNFIWLAEMEINNLCGCCQTTDNSTTTVASTQEYAKPVTCVAIDRLTWYNLKLKKVTLTEQDAMDGTGAGGSVAEGNPHSYYEYGANVGLYPIPDSAQTLKFWYTYSPTRLTNSSTDLSVPLLFHNHLHDYGLYRAYLQDKQYERANAHLGIWRGNMASAIRDWRRSQNKDRYAVVKTEDNYPTTGLGMR